MRWLLPLAIIALLLLAAAVSGCREERETPPEAEVTAPAETVSSAGPLPAEGRIAGTEHFIEEAALGRDYLNHVWAAEYRLEGLQSPLQVYLAVHDRGEPAAEVWQQLAAEAEASDYDEVVGVGNQCFVADHPVHGSIVVARQGGFVVIVMGREAPRQRLLEFAQSVADDLRSRTSPD